MIKHMKTGIPVILAALLFTSCLNSQLPYLKVEFSDEPYLAGNGISIYYEFVSESEEQPCRYTLYNTNDPGFAILDNQGREIPSSGIITTPPLEDGWYRFEFVVQSSRNGETRDLYFLSYFREFRVDL